MGVISITDHKTFKWAPSEIDAAVVVYLPVAPQTVARTRFSPPPPPRSQCLMVPEALDLLHRSMEERRGLVSMVAISGPGDPFATPDNTLQTVELVRSHYPDLRIGLQTFGIGARTLAPELAKAGVDSISILVDGVRKEILEKLYAWIRPGLKTLKLASAAELLIKEQQNGVPALKFHDLTVQVQSTVYPGLNAEHIPKISSEMLELGADTITLLPYQAAPEVEVCLEEPGCEMMADIASKTSAYLPLSQPIIAPQKISELTKSTVTASPKLPKPTPERPNIAVASSNGIEVDLHLGHAIKFLIYGPREDGLACLLEARDAPDPGSGEKRWLQLAETLADCSVLLVASAGETPRRILADKGLTIIITEDNIEGTVDVLYGGGKKKKSSQPR